MALARNKRVLNPSLSHLSIAIGPRVELCSTRFALLCAHGTPVNNGLFGCSAEKAGQEARCGRVRPAATSFFLHELRHGRSLKLTDLDVGVIEDEQVGKVLDRPQERWSLQQTRSLDGEPHQRSIPASASECTGKRIDPRQLMSIPLSCA